MKKSAQDAGFVTSFAPTAPLNSTKKKDEAILSVHYVKDVVFALQHARPRQLKEDILQISRYLLRSTDYFARPVNKKI